MSDLFGEFADYAFRLQKEKRENRLNYYIPFEAALGNSFENSAKSFLKAKDAERSGTMEDLKTWHMAERAEFWEPSMSKREIVISKISYDPKTAIENQDHAGMIIDSQKHLELDTVGTFHWETYVADKSGNSWQTARGFATSWDELRAVQKENKIPNSDVCIDGRKWTPAIIQKCAEFRELQKGTLYGREINFWSVWKIFMGDDARHFPWPDKQFRVWSPPTFRPEVIMNAKGQREIVRVGMYRWSNPTVKDQLNELLIGGEGKPKFNWLDRSQISERQRAKEQGDWTWEKQHQSEVRNVEKNGKVVWLKISSGRPNHGWDISNMRLVNMAMHGLAGHQMSPE